MYYFVAGSNATAKANNNSIIWNTNSLWVEVSIVTFVILLGNIFLGHFEERSPNWRKLLKYFVTLAIVIVLSIAFGRAIALTVLGLMLVPVAYIHGVVLPKKGINGWTGEPKARYYEFRGWAKNVFEVDKKGRVQKTD